VPVFIGVQSINQAMPQSGSVNPVWGSADIMFTTKISGKAIADQQLVL